MLLFSLASHLCAQVVEVHGGTSTLFESSGGEVDIKANSYNASFGAGTIGRHFLGGAHLSKRYESSTYTLGTQNIPFDLPTDIFDSGHNLTTLGGSVRSRLPHGSVLLFGGMMSENFESPFFSGTQGEQPAAIFLFDGLVRPNVSVATRVILTRQISMIEGIAWRPATWAQLAASGGVGSGKGYGAVSAKLKNSIFDLQTAYIDTNPGFRRANGETIPQPESDHLNASLTITPTSRFSATIGHSHYLVPVTGSDQDTHSSIDQLETDTIVHGVTLAGSVFRSTYSTGSNKAFVLSASKTFGPKISAQGSYLYSTSNAGKPTASIIANFSEALSPRWTVTEIVNNTNGQTTLGFGTTFLSNIATVTAEYETYYLPQHLPSPFEEVLILNADLNLFGRATVHGDTFVAPDGSLKHTVSASGVFVRHGDSIPSTDRNPFERFVLLGRVVDELNRPVEGAALLIDRVPVYTDSDGNFILRENQSRYHSLQVLTRQFLDGGEYMIVSATHNIRSTLPEDAVKTIVVVQRLQRPCANGVPCKT